MRFTLYSEKAEGLGIATHLSSEGHGVTMYNDNGMSAGAGIVDTGTPDGQDIMIFDSDVYGGLADDLRAKGQRTLGTSLWSEAISSDPTYRANLIKLIGWNSDHVDAGVNLYITTWFNGAHYLNTYASLVYRRFMSSGRGPDVNGTGVLGSFEQPTENVYNHFLKPLEPILRRVNHRGCVHIHAVISGDRVSVKDINTSMTSPLALLLFENAKQSLADILVRLFDENSKPIQSLERWASSILVSIPPYPYEIVSQPVRLGLQTPALKHLWLIDVKKEGSDWFSAGLSGKIGYVTARGESVREAVKRAYRTVGNFQVRDIQYRDDVGRNLHNLLDSLKNYGWIK